MIVGLFGGGYMFFFCVLMQRFFCVLMWYFLFAKPCGPNGFCKAFFVFWCHVF